MAKLFLLFVALFAASDAFMVPASKLAVSSASSAVAVPARVASTTVVKAVKKPVKKPVKEVVKKVVKKVAKKPAKKTLRRESARAGVERGAAMLGDTFIVPTGPVAIGVGVWILVLLRFVIFYGFFGGE